MRLLALCEGTTVPASRFRVAQFVEPWRALGIDVEVRYAYGDQYNRWAATRVGPLYKLATRLKRIPWAGDADEFDVVFVQRPGLPQSALPERLLQAINPRIVFDFDDSVHLGPGGAPSPARERTLHGIIALSQAVIAGNAHLAELANAPDKTTVIPTVIDTDRYTPPSARSGPQITIGWMGTSGNFPFLEHIVGPVRDVLQRRRDVSVRLVSNAEFAPLAGVERVEQVRWSAATEIDLLRSFDIGLMPLTDTPLTRGKCAFKMIQYMAVGTPVVASAVGANVEVFAGSPHGYCLREWSGWSDALLALVDDEAARRQMGEAGRARAVDTYSIRAVLPLYSSVFDRIAGAPT